MRLTPNAFVNSSKKKYSTLLVCTLFLVSGLFMGWKNVPGMIKANLFLISNIDFFDIITEKNNFETIQISISFENLQKLEAKKLEAKTLGLLTSTNDDFVKADISYNGTKSRCKLRLKGDLSDHWAGDKVSLRVEMRDDKLIKGMSRFSLQDPVTRGNTAEWLYLETLRSEGCMAVRYDFVNLTLNGKDMGIYAMEEHFSKELIEANHRREGVIVRFDDYLLWKKFPKDIASNIEWNSIFRSAPASSRNSKRINKNEMLNLQKETAFNLLRSMQESRLSPSQIFDREKLGKFLAITRLWQAESGLLFGDINFYFNPVTCLLEPIGFDGNPKLDVQSPYCYFSWGDIKDNWVNFALKDPSIASAYVSSLHKYTEDSFFLNLKNQYSKKESIYRNLLGKDLLLKSPAEIWKNYYSLTTYNPWPKIEERAKFILRELSEEHIILPYGLLKDFESNLQITVRNVTTQPVEIFGFSSGDTFWSAFESLTDKTGKPSHPESDTGNLILFGQANGYDQTSGDLHFTISNHEIVLPLYVECRLLGSPYKFKRIPIPCDKNAFNYKNLPLGKYSSEENYDLNQLIVESEDGLFIPAGVHTVNENISIPPNKKLFISPGTTLNFDENITFVSESPLFLHGTTEKPIIFTSSNQSWSGMLLANANGKSIFENVKFLNVGGVGIGPNPKGAKKNGWTMTGGLTIYNSSSSFRHCMFENFYTEDALNIISSSFSISDCTFSSHFSDAFDGDFVNGQIVDCSFYDIAGDGVDFSGSNAVVSNSLFSDINDKAISVGEGSSVKVYSCKIDNVSFGIASKDLSVTEASNITITNVKTAAFAAFQKKDSFGPASIVVSQPKISDCKQLFMVQDGSHGRLDDQIVRTSVFEMNALY